MQQWLRKKIDRLVAPWYGKWLSKYRWGRILSRMYDRVFSLLTPSKRKRVATIYGFSLWINPSWLVVERNLQLYGVYEYTVCEVMRRLLTTWSVFVDVWANIGYHSLLAAHCVGSPWRVYACEPSHENLALLEKNAAFFPQITIYPYGLGKEESEMTLYFDSKNPGASSVVVPKNKKESITLQKGDTLFAPIAEITVMKIDIEWYEFEAMQGMHTTLLTKTKALLFEYSPEYYMHLTTDGFGYSCAMISFLQQCGFCCRYDLWVGKNPKIRILKATTPEYLIAQLGEKQTNLLCCKIPYDLFGTGTDL